MRRVLLGGGLLAACGAPSAGPAAPERTIDPPEPPAPAPLDAAAVADELGPRIALLPDGTCPAVTLLEPGSWSRPGADEGRVVFSPDGKEAFFHRQRADQRLEIVVSRRDREGWTAPRAVAFSGGRFDDLDPFVTWDGRWLLFASFRPDDPAASEPRKDSDLWIVRRDADGWGVPRRLAPDLNTGANELFPSTTADGTLYWNSDRAGGQGAWDLYRARAAADAPATWAMAENLGAPINTTAWEYNPVPTPDGRWILFGSLNRTGGLGGSDLWVARLDGVQGPNAAPRPLGACINSAAEEYHPAWAPHLGGFTFVRNEGQGGDLYAVPLSP